MKIFISYSSKDRELVTALEEDLKALGHEIWFDPELSYRGGQKWWDTILANIRTCDLFLLALTPNALASPACQSEYEYAHALDKRILPILMTAVDIAALPTELQELQFVDYTNRSVRKALALAGSLGNLPAIRPVPEPSPDEPPVPLSPLARLGQELDALTLSSNKQIELLFKLETLFNASLTRNGAEVLLRKLYDHPDLAFRVGDRIRSLIPDIDGAQPVEKLTEPSSNTKTRRGLPLRGGAVAIAAVVIIVVAALILRQPGTTPAGISTPTPIPLIAAQITATDTISASLTPTRLLASPTASLNAPVVNNIWTPLVQQFNGVDMVLVPLGCFMLGSNIGNDDEKPVTKICFDKPFWIDRTEVTQAQFKQFGGLAATPPYFKGDNRPVENISWSEARDFCKRRGVRLPTETEWEFAARGPDDLIYPWGNSPDTTKSVYNRAGSEGTAEVGSIPGGASWVGALDLSGNVWEWVSTIYKRYPYAVDDGRESNADSTSARVIRGGSWSISDVIRAAGRAGQIPSQKGISIGFRCGRDQ